MINNYTRFTLAIALLAIFLYSAPVAHSISITGTTQTLVQPALTVTKISDMDFGTDVQGSPNKRIRPRNFENDENASFLIEGVANAAITITTPPGSIFLDHTSSGDQLEVRRFRSTPRGTSTIRNTGERMLYVGAQRRRIPNNVASGLYTGTFTVTVVY